MDFRRLYRLRESRGLTQTKLGEIMDVSHVTIHRWETGDPNSIDWLEKVERLARALGCHPGELFEDLPSSPALTNEEQAFLEAYRRAGSELRAAMRRMVESPTTEPPFSEKHSGRATG